MSKVDVIKPHKRNVERLLKELGYAIPKSWNHPEIGALRDQETAREEFLLNDSQLKSIRKKKKQLQDKHDRINDALQERLTAIRRGGA